MSGARVEIFTLAYSDDTLASVPTAPGVTAVDLRRLSVDVTFDDGFAESRFMLSPEAGASDADVIGVCSVNYDRKWPEPPHLVELPRLARHLEPSWALGVELANLDDWMASAEHNHPGMAGVLQRLAREFGLELYQHRVPGCSTFICHRDHYLAYLERFSTLLNAAIGWYGTDIPFRYRCPDCGSVSDTGFGRWTNSRHVGYLGERITRLIFASRPEITFWTPGEFERLSPVRSLRGRVHRKARAVVGGRKAEPSGAAQPWHLSTTGIGGDRATEFSLCPVCTERAS